MVSGLQCTQLEIDSCAVAFQTDCSDALRRLEGLLAEIFSSPYYQYRLIPGDADRRLPTLRYLDRNAYRVDFEPEEDLCVLLAPWSEISNSSLLGMFLYVLSEVVRQRNGEYLLHASAVVRDGQAIVLSGPERSGKTTMALHLCLKHGFKLFANNKVKAMVQAGELRLVRGDPVFNFRLIALRRYSTSLSDQVFPGMGGHEAPWKVKKVVPPDRLQIETAPPCPRLATFTFLQLDGEQADARVDRLGDGVAGDAEFAAKADLYEQLSGLIRGSRFLPIVPDLGFKDFFVPCFDRPEFGRRRTAFLESLFSSSRVVKIRGPLDKAADAVLHHHGLATCNANR